MTALYWVVDCLATLVECIVCCAFTGIFVEKKNVKKRILVYSVFFSLFIIMMNKISLFSSLNGVMSIVILASLQVAVYTRKIKTLILSTVIFSIIDMAIDFTVVQMGAIVFSINTGEVLLNYGIERIFCTIMSKTILLIVVYLMHKYNRNKTQISGRHLGICGLIACILVALDYYIAENSMMAVNDKMRMFLGIYFISSIVIILLVFSLVLKLGENYHQKNEISLLELQNEMMIRTEKNTEQVFNMWRGSIHDYKHKIFAIRHWLEEGNVDNVKEFVEQECENLTQKMFYVKTGNSAVDSIINTKQKIAEDKGIIFSSNISLPAEYAVSDMDMVCVLGNLIDNAIEACEKQTSKYIEVDINEVKKMILIKIVNSYNGEKIDTSVTSKKEKTMHGIGIKNVKKIVAKYKGMYDMECEDDEVVTTVTMLYK